MKRIFCALILAFCLTGCINRNPPNALETVIYTPIAGILRALNPEDALFDANVKEIVRLYYVVWEHDR